MTTGYKPTNPKDSVGVRKVPFSTVSAPVVLEIGVAMLEGARKYGRHNYRDGGVLASVYYDAALRHLATWWEGEDLDPDSGLSHVTKALASLVVLRDATLQGVLTDDRPPATAPGWLDRLNQRAAEIVDRYPDAPEPFTEAGRLTLPGTNPSAPGTEEALAEATRQGNCRGLAASCAPAEEQTTAFRLEKALQHAMRINAAAQAAGAEESARAAQTTYNTQIVDDEEVGTPLIFQGR